MSQSPKEPLSKPDLPDAPEQTDAKVIRLIPRRPVTERETSPPTHDDTDNDPGPSVA